MIMNDELLKMLPMSEIDADIHSSVPVIGNKLSVQVFGVRGSKGHNGNVTELRKRVAGYQ